MKISHFLEGFLQVHVDVPFPTRLLNLCANEGISFRTLVWEGETRISFVLPQAQLSRLRALVSRLGGTLDEEKAGGLPVVLGRLGHRLGFLLGLGLSLFAVSVLSRYILVVDISGNERVSTGEIRVALERAGLDVGVNGKDLAVSMLTQEALSYLDGVSWMSVNIYGTRAEVVVMETVLSPEIVPRDGFYDVVSQVSGIVTEIQVHKGEALVAVGDTVLAGQVLISGHVELEPPLYSDYSSMWLREVAGGMVWARTWRELTAVMPLETLVKVDFGITVNSFSLEYFGERMGFLEHSVLFPSGYEKTYSVSTLPYMPLVPVSFSHGEERGYQLESRAVNYDAAVEMLENRLLEELVSRIGEGGEVLASDFAVVDEEGLLKVTLASECREEIGTLMVGVPRTWEDLEHFDLEE